MRIAVVGAGAVGTTAGALLAADGHTVTIYEAGEVASGATGRAAGLVYAANTDPVDASHGSASLATFTRFDGCDPFTFTRCPYVWFVTEPGEPAAALHRGARRMQANGGDVELIDGTDLAARFPALECGDIEAAAVAWNAGYTTPADFATLQAERAIDAGATLRENTPVTVETDSPGIRVDGAVEHVDAVAVAAGAHTPRLLRDAGYPLAAKPYRVQALTADGDGTTLPMLYDATAGVYARPHPVGLLAGDGTEEVEADPDTYREAGDDWFVERVTEWLGQRVSRPGDVERAWAGLCVATPDENPLVGPVGSGVVVATGWQGHGFMRSPAMGELLADCVTSGTAPVDAFDPTRFSGEENFAITEGMGLE